MKGFAQIILLSLWFFAIVAPSVITLLDKENPVWVTNLNEEEQQEAGKKAQASQKIINDGHFDFSLIAQSNKIVLGDCHSIGYFDYTLEILLPPPEHIG
ncbi:hypothetical protein LCGC14_3135950 [marine sediment metagenome]|uniref:Uncharacterized protein n=2 Tax=root TaxID=1 RepID=A0A831QKT0_9FLAO|nr:hypothetical protein [Pricia antarctica]